MSREKVKSASKNPLTSEQIELAAQWMLLGAEAHQRASIYCRSKPDAQPPSLEAVFFPVVAFELILLSIEQSLKALLLIRYSTVRDHHYIFRLYNELTNKGGRKRAISKRIVDRTSFVSRSEGIGNIEEEDIRACLKKHNSSYVSFRYFNLDNKGRISDKWEMKSYEVQVLNCLAWALLHVIHDEMQKKGMSVLSSMSLVPESDMSDDVKAMVARMKERSTR